MLIIFGEPLYNNMKIMIIIIIIRQNIININLFKSNNTMIITFSIDYYLIEIENKIVNTIHTI